MTRNWLVLLSLLALHMQAVALDYFTLPKTIQATVDKLCPGARLEGVTTTNQANCRVYEVDVRHRGRERSLTIATDGVLISRQVFLEELTPALQASVKQQMGEAKLEEIYWTNEEGTPYYCFQLKEKKGTRTVTLALDGFLISRQALPSEVPAAVQAAIKEKLAGRAPMSVDRSEDEGEVFYEVYDLNQGKERLWLLETNGAVAAQPVELDAMPEPARKALLEQINHARIVRLLTYADEAGKYFEATFVRNEEGYVCAVNERGEILSEELPLSAVPASVQAQIKAQTAGAHVARIERTRGAQGMEYEVSFRRQGKAENVTVPGW